MRPVGFVLEDDEVPRTVFYDRFREAVARHPWAGTGAAPTLLIPAEDTAIETNWPRYGAGASVYTRGSQPVLSADSPYGRYLDQICRFAAGNPDKRVLVLNKHPAVRVGTMLRHYPNIILADGSLAAFERSLNPRTISLPSLPLVKPKATPGGARPVLASFQGVDSHAVRRSLQALNDDREIIVRLVHPTNHLGKIDAETGVTDSGYEALIDASVFSFVPRGDSLFSYRLLEVMARGSIPVILSDGWVLPFDRTLDWPSFSLSVHHDAIKILPRILKLFTPAEVARMQERLARAYETAFADLDRIVSTLLEEAGRLA